MVIYYIENLAMGMQHCVPFVLLRYMSMPTMLAATLSPATVKRM
jgi:hypothetical protein